MSGNSDEGELLSKVDSNEIENFYNLLMGFPRRAGFLLSGIFLNIPVYRNFIVNQFHQLFYGSYTLDRPWTHVSWLGVPASKSPLDLWVYQEILNEVKPEKIIESGTSQGGTAYFLASICDCIGKGEVLSIDIQPPHNRPQHLRTSYLHGSSTDPSIVERVRSWTGSNNRVMVLLDSDHNREHVLKELSIYSQFVTPGSYLIVEDTNLNGHPVWPGFGPGPMEAVKEFLRHSNEFLPDRNREKFYFTFNPSGFLKRVK